ncbi:MAG: hypothetical protein AVDCRST_MAG77-4747, partial [uncultured Chloroflexi bacterium]
DNYRIGPKDPHPPRGTALADDFDSQRDNDTHSVEGANRGRPVAAHRRTCRLRPLLRSQSAARTRRRRGHSHQDHGLRRALPPGHGRRADAPRNRGGGCRPRVFTPQAGGPHPLTGGGHAPSEHDRRPRRQRDQPGGRAAPGERRRVPDRIRARPAPCAHDAVPRRLWRGVQPRDGVLRRPLLPNGVPHLQVRLLSASPGCPLPGRGYGLSHRHVRTGPRGQPHDRRTLLRASNHRRGERVPCVAPDQGSTHRAVAAASGAQRPAGGRHAGLRRRAAGLRGTARPQIGV